MCDRTIWQWNDLVQTFVATANRSCTAATPLPSCAAQVAQDAVAESDLRDRIEQCFFASPDCFRPDESPDFRRATIQTSLDAVGPHVLALVHRVLLNGKPNPRLKRWDVSCARYSLLHVVLHASRWVIYLHIDERLTLTR